MIVREFGVVLLRAALNESEQRALLAQVKARCVAGKDFHVSSGTTQRVDPLHALGEAEAGCDAFAELGIKFPDAPEAIVKRAEIERRRAGCAS